MPADARQQHRMPESQLQMTPDMASVASADAKLHKVLRTGVFLILVGLSPEKFVEKPGIQAALRWAFLSVFYVGFTIHEILGAVIFPPSLLGAIAHAYVASYISSFAVQWLYFYWIIPKIYYTRRLRLDDFCCPRSEPQFTEKTVDDVLKTLTKVLRYFLGWLGFNTLSHLFGPLIEAAITYFQGGQVTALFMLPQVFLLPMWAQIIMYVCNAVTTGGLMFYCAGAYTIMGVEVAQIKILCAILNEALKNAPDDRNISNFVRDHVMILQRAKTLNEDLALINALVFTSGYLSFATQMFVITFFDLNLSYYISLPVDMFSIFLIVAFQCFMGSEITDALRSVANGPYASEWYKKEKRISKHVVLMTQMAQQAVEPTTWFGSLTVERATCLNLLRSSYAAYTVLMIFQK